MKLPCSLYSKETILNKIAKRTNKRINEYTSVSNSLAADKAGNIKKNLDSISKFAERKNCNLEFVPGEDLYENSAKMKVYKRGLILIRDREGMPVAAFNNQSLSGEAFLPDKVSDNKSFMKSLRDQVKNIIKNDKNWDNKFTEY